MGDLKSELYSVKKKIREKNKARLTLPSYFNFKDHDSFDFSKTLSFFDWGLKNQSVSIDFSNCKSANYQTLALVILYAWKLKSNNCTVEFLYGEDEQGASAIWRMMGGPGLFSVCFNENQNFRSNANKPIVAIRNNIDFKLAMDKTNDFSSGFDIELINTLRYVVSELLYNTLEHGKSFFEDGKSRNRRIPSLIQFSWYQKRDEIQFIVGDVGIGVKRHLMQTYTDIENDEDALRLAIRPQISGTFSSADPYTSKNNAGMGLFISSNIIKRLNADMHIISGNAVLHISPLDITTRHLELAWPGTFALVNIKVGNNPVIELHKLMSEFREAADREQAAKTNAENKEKYYVHMRNFFGTYPEDKSAAIKFRDEKLLLAIGESKKIVLDFDGVSSSPHSFLNALLATPIKRLGIQSYKNIKIINALPEIRETIDFIFEDNTSDNSLNL